MVRVFERGLNKPTGFVLPVQRWNAPDGRKRWKSERWSLRRGHLYLVPGDSPVGFRLPIGSLPYVAPSAYPHVVPQDPFEARAPLPDPPPQPVAAASSQDGGAARQDVQEQRHVEGAVRTALAVEVRDGIVCVFMPPVERLEDYLEHRRRHRGECQGRRPAGADRRLPAAVRPPPQRHQGDARSRRDRGQHPSRRELARGGRYDDVALRRGAPVPPRRRQVHDRRPPYRHRRRQPRRRRRREARRFAVPAPARSPEEPRALLAAASLAVLSCSPASSSGRRARRRASTRRGTTTSTNSKSRSPRCRARRKAGAALARRPAVPQPARRRHRQHAPGRNLHR